eukprot:GHVS01084104.1.p1 GENE.GHVS01084104.1~~GHVS01084104.1.p1  ORF type:complete len:476 (-),score=41.48 GHVS01084104.1:161-1588(-)
MIQASPPLQLIFQCVHNQVVVNPNVKLICLAPLLIMAHKRPAVKPKVCIVGAGNAAHVLSAWLPSRGYETYWFASFQDEAKRLNEALSVNKTISVEFDTMQAKGAAGEHSPLTQASVSTAPHLQPSGLVKGAPVKVSKEASDVVPQCDVILAPVPTFTYQDLLKQLKPYLRSGQYLGITPGQGGFDWMAVEVLGKELYDKLNVFTVLPMPLNCRIVEFGKLVHVTALKQNFRVACNISKDVCFDGEPSDPHKMCELVQSLFDAENVDHIGHLIGGTLYPINAVLHPARNFSVVGKDYVKGKTFLPANPLFYEDMDETSIRNIRTVSEELGKVGKVLNSRAISCGKKIDVNIPTVLEFLQFVYGKRYSTLEEMFVHNPAYKGYRCPMKQVEAGWEPSITDRYYTEDIPLGLCLIKGVAEIVEVETPLVDTIILWAQNLMAKEYLVNGKLQGKDVAETSAPQRFGITTFEKLASYYN